jgi:hypothetical protein
MVDGGPERDLRVVENQAWISLTLQSGRGAKDVVAVKSDLQHSEAN